MIMVRRGERGMALAIEAAIIIPTLVLCIGLLVVMARVGLADSHVGAAAAAGARAASLERSPTDQVAREAVRSALKMRNVSCRRTNIGLEIGTSRIIARVTCVLDLSDVGLLLMPGQITVTQVRTSVIDPLRGR